jgi:hypothetical protein
LAPTFSVLHHRVVGAEKFFYQNFYRQKLSYI